MISCHSAYPGCGAIIGIRNILEQLGKDVIVIINENCVFRATVKYPYTSWDIPMIFSDSMDPITIAMEVKENTESKNVVVILERENFFVRDLEEFESSKIIVICYDKIGWYDSNKFPLRFFGRNIYAVNASISHLRDLDEKIRKAKEKTTVINILTPCPISWKINPRYTVKIARIGVEALVFPLYEVYKEGVRISVKIDNPRSIFEYTKLQGRFENINEEEVLQREKEYMEFYQSLLALSEKSLSVVS